MPLLNSILPDLPSTASFTFTERPEFVPVSDRLSYRLPMIACSLAACRKERSTFVRLALMNFGVRSYRLRTSLTRVARGISTPNDVTVGFDGLFPRVLDLAVKKSIVEYVEDEGKGAIFRLAEDGRQLRAVVAEYNLFTVERLFFENVATILTENAVLKIMSGISP